MVRKIVGHDIGHIYAMKVLKKATLKGISFYLCIILIQIMCLVNLGLKSF